jgi:hypothetical protein
MGIVKVLTFGFYVGNFEAVKIWGFMKDFWSNKICGFSGGFFGAIKFGILAGKFWSSKILGSCRNFLEH